MAKKKLTLNETWRLCLSMWKWIAKQKRAGTLKDTYNLKVEWLQKHWVGKDVYDECFFCDYQIQHRKREYEGASDCPGCPGALVDKWFDCYHSGCDWFYNPIAFYNKLVSLNRKRKKKAKG